MQSAEHLNNQLLGSWKEIASYMRKSVRTVQRWETFGLPVRRPLAKSKGLVQASREDLDRWMASEWAQRAGYNKPNGHNRGNGHQPDLTRHFVLARDLRHSNRKLVSEIEETIQKIHRQCESLQTHLRRPAG